MDAEAPEGANEDMPDDFTVRLAVMRRTLGSLVSTTLLCWSHVRLTQLNHSLSRRAALRASWVGRGLHVGEVGGVDAGEKLAGQEAHGNRACSAGPQQAQCPGMLSKVMFRSGRFDKTSCQAPQAAHRRDCGWQNGGSGRAGTPLRR